MLFDHYLAHIDASDAILRHEVGEPRLIERYLRQHDRLDLQRLLTAVVALSLLLLLAYFRHYRRLGKQLDASHRQVLEQQQALREANQQLERMSMTDGLTGLANRRRFDEQVTLSIGVATQTGQHPTTDSLLAEADARLYQAKRGGRNRVCSG